MANFCLGFGNNFCLPWLSNTKNVIEQHSKLHQYLLVNILFMANFCLGFGNNFCLPWLSNTKNVIEQHSKLHQYLLVNILFMANFCLGFGNNFCLPWLSNTKYVIEQHSKLHVSQHSFYGKLLSGFWQQLLSVIDHYCLKQRAKLFCKHSVWSLLCRGI